MENSEKNDVGGPVACTPIVCETAATKLKRRLPYGWDLNVYRGCGHGCCYCYAQYTHGYLGGGDFASKLYVKQNVAEMLEKQLSAPGWKREIINLGGVTDNYQPAEETHKMMPELLRLLIRYKTPVIISTKSDLILRDLDLIDELSRVAYVNIAVSLISVQDVVLQKLEPGAAPAQRRLAVLQAFGKTGATTGLHCMPIIPYITDGQQELDALFCAAQKAQVDYLLPGTLYLRGGTRAAFFDVVRKEFPHLEKKLAALYKTGGAGKEYKEALYGDRVNPLRQKYGLSGSYSQPMKQKIAELAAREAKQLSFLESEPN